MTPQEIPTANAAHPAIACFGAVHMDTITHARRPIQADTSTPATMSDTPGGVATNVARALARLDVNVQLFGTCGDDPAGQSLKILLQDDGVRTLLTQRPGMTTGRYIAFHNPDGGLISACVDDLILETAPAHLFDEAMQTAAGLATAAWWFADANLPAALLERLSQMCPAGKLAVDGVSQAKAGRLVPILDRIGILFLNVAEARAVLAAATKSDFHDVDRCDRKELAARLLQLGPDTVLITDGASGVYWTTTKQEANLPAEPAKIVDTTGAGDALIAGTLAGLAHGAQFADAAVMGIGAARQTLASAGAVAPTLSLSSLK
ncbi:pseudouridine kinase [Roseibium hamelinense]|uniref:Pseudouridine kinase n=1 Tax=Roseibium hamelinense TaxID=150831 RepID=A0A562T9S0_9HYPH|nr:PfkB family carbohydrate kinase [Roseibium hamelinense]MTI45215.1 carbohydrate kinase [Roseibium hamelinense]TWI90421.1 pseudouridine kinase [Roseibium hamelinense]